MTEPSLEVVDTAPFAAARRTSFRVMKFGGTSVATAERMLRIAMLVERAVAEERVAVVASALAGVTDDLASGIREATSGGPPKVAAHFLARHLALVEELGGALEGERRRRLHDELAGIAGELDERLRGVALLHDCSPRVEARIVTLGERASCAILRELLASRGLEPELLDPLEFLPCQGDRLQATPLPNEMRRRMGPVRDGRHALYILPGFFGGDARGDTMCLGRGGSDFSAALLAQALAARRLEIWTDVDGLYTADPRLVPAARCLERLSFEEALELAHFGAKVLHPGTIAPARAAGVPVAILNTFAPERPGTVIEPRGSSPSTVACGISFLRGVALVDVFAPGMPGLPGAAARIFAALAQHRIEVVLITQGSSETALSLAVRSTQADEAREALRQAFESEIATGRMDDVVLRRGLAIVSLVGDGMRERSGVSGRFFAALGAAGVSVAAIAQGASERSICAAIAECDGERAVVAVHREFFEAVVAAPTGRRPQYGWGPSGQAGRDAPLVASPAAAFAPAGIGNLAAGFDVLGAAIEPLEGEPWGDVVEVGPRADGKVEDSLVVTGRWAHRLPADPRSNLVWRARDSFASRLERPLPPLAFVLHKNLPVASGLGSSAASVAATLVAMNESLGKPLAADELLAAAAEAEGQGCGAAHLDNVAPALFGGLRLVDAAGRAHRLPFPTGLLFVLWRPDLELETRAARSVLPREVGLAETVAHAQNLATLLHALHTGDTALLADALHDSLAEPHRAALVPGFRAVQAAARAHGALGASLSGAGPSIFAVAAAEIAPEVAAAGAAAWRAEGVTCEARVCRLDTIGARVVTP